MGWSTGRKKNNWVPAAAPHMSSSRVVETRGCCGPVVSSTWLSRVGEQSGGCGAGGERGVALPPLTLSPRFPFPRSGRCSSWTCATQWTAIRLEGTPRTKTHLVPGTQTLCLLPGAEGIGCSYFLLPPFTLPEELWKIHPLDKTPRWNWMFMPPCSLRLTELLLFPAWPCLLRAPTVEGALDPESRGLRLAL